MLLHLWWYMVCSPTMRSGESYVCIWFSIGTQPQIHTPAVRPFLCDIALALVLCPSNNYCVIEALKALAAHTPFNDSENVHLSASRGFSRLRAHAHTHAQTLDEARANCTHAHTCEHTHSRKLCVVLRSMWALIDQENLAQWMHLIVGVMRCVCEWCIASGFSYIIQL